MTATPQDWQDHSDRQHPPGATGSSTLVVHVDGSAPPGSFRVGVEVDGVPLDDPQGTLRFALAPGLHTVACSTAAAGQVFGRAQLQVEVPVGATLPVHYAPPAALGGAGRLGFAPMVPPRRSSAAGCGLAAAVVGLVVVVVLVTVAVVAFVATG